MFIAYATIRDIELEWKNILHLFSMIFSFQFMQMESIFGLIYFLSQRISVYLKDVMHAQHVSAFDRHYVTPNRNSPLFIFFSFFFFVDDRTETGKRSEMREHIANDMQKLQKWNISHSWHRKSNGRIIHASKTIFASWMPVEWVSKMCVESYERKSCEKKKLRAKRENYARRERSLCVCVCHVLLSSNRLNDL